MKQAVKKAALTKKTSPPAFPTPIIPFAIGALIVCIGLYQAINVSWVSDDAFITFRYVQNFVAGHGIVYNAGEYVEGYTHFLWLLILSAAKIIGFDPVKSSIWLGILCYASILVLYIIIARKEKQKSANNSSTKFFIPLTAALLAFNYDMNVWASGGLETALYTLLLSLAFFIWFYTGIQEKKKILTVGCILLLATLTRPDGALFTTTASLLLALKGVKEKKSAIEIGKKIGLLILPTLIIGIPYLLWKYNYYGDIFPTPYYAKSASESYFGQGFFYIYLFFKVYASLALALLACIVIWFMNRRSDVSASAASESNSGSPVIAAIIAVAMYLILYVARVGGDFMFARFIIPVLPFLYYLLERGVDSLPEKIGQRRLIICLALIAAIFAERQFRENTLFHVDASTHELSGNWNDDDGGETRGIADERWVYTRKRFVVDGEMVGSLDVYCDIGQFYKTFFDGLPVKVAIMGGQNSIAYNADFFNCIDVYGLTDNYIAHLPITKRGRIGHEKEAPFEYLLKRGTHLEFFGVTIKQPESYTFDVAVFAIPRHNCWQLAKIINYDKAIMTELDRRFKAAGIPAVLPLYEKVMPEFMKNILPTLTSEQAQKYYTDLQDLYFNKYPDPPVQHQILDYIAAKKKEEQAK